MKHLLNTLRNKLRSWLGVIPTKIEAVKKKKRIRSDAAVALKAKAQVPYELTGIRRYPLTRLPLLPPGVIPESAKTDPSYMAMDDALGAFFGYAGQFEGLGYCGFPGYPRLAELTQISEYRSPSETLADEMTRKWIRIKAQGKGKLADKIEVIEAQLKFHKVKEILHSCALNDGFFGRGQIYIDNGASDDIRKTPLILDPATFKKGTLKGFKSIEPIWTTPHSYDSLDPTSKAFFVPVAWFILGKQTHSSRLLTMISHPVPDLLKPSYNFSGQSMTQLMEPYVTSWLKTRDNVGRIIRAFSTSGIKTDMSAILNEEDDGTSLQNRAEVFNAARDNFGLMILDNSDAEAPEEFFQFNIPLSTLDKLQAQSQEHMAAPSHMPLVKLLGLTPTGLNATTEGEMDVWYDYVEAKQSNNFTDILDVIIKVIQLDQFGEIDSAIGFEYEPLSQMTKKELAEVRKSDAEAAAAYIGSGVISPEEERERLATDLNSGYSNLNVEDAPVLPNDNDQDAGEIDE